MSVSQARSRGSWNARVLGDMLASSATQAVVFTDTNGRIVHCDLRREMPEGFAEFLDCVLSAQAGAGERFGLGKPTISASLFDGGTLVWGRGSSGAVAVLASGRANLGQLISQVRRVFPEGEL